MSVHIQEICRCTYISQWDGNNRKIPWVQTWRNIAYQHAWWVGRLMEEEARDGRTIQKRNPKKTKKVCNLIHIKYVYMCIGINNWIKGFQRSKACNNIKKLTAGDTRRMDTMYKNGSREATRPHGNPGKRCRSQGLRSNGRDGRHERTGDLSWKPLLRRSSDGLDMEGVKRWRWDSRTNFKLFTFATWWVMDPFYWVRNGLDGKYSSLWGYVKSLRCQLWI